MARARCRPEDALQMGQQTRVSPRLPAPAQVAVGPHEKARRLCAIGLREPALPIVVQGDARLVLRVMRGRYGDDTQASPQPRPDLPGEVREISQDLRGVASGR